MLTLRQITLSRGNKILLDKADVSLYEKQKIGLIGHNGCGKSTLFDFLLGKLIADTGEYLINPQLSISHLSQQLPDSDEKALDFVLAGDEEYIKLLQRLEQAEQSGNDTEVLACHDELSHSGGYSKPAQAATIMSGLGFRGDQQQASVNSFSGGWRMRLSLARCLMKPAALLLLDEPTNHLDMEAIFWLERFLKQSPSTIILISHDREFLDAFVTHILHIDHQQLNLYTGDYSCFEKTHAQQLALQQIMHERQQAKISHMMSFVNRFKAKATKAKQAQSRVKAIEKMEIIAAAQADSPFSFDFFPCPRAGNPLIQCNLVDAGYQNPILKKINLSLNPGDRIALLGPNGEGKSTLIKTLTGVLPTLNGTIHRSAHLKIGYYAQHQLEQLDCKLSPVETIQILSPEVREQTIRDYLGGFNFIGDMAVQPIQHFSGGEKARLALAKLVWLKPNLLLLDEPTNHLDLGMRSAIELALQSYEGALILISHDRHMLKTSVDNFYLVHNQKVQAFDGDLDDYYSWLQSKDIKPATSAQATNDYKEKKVIQNRLKKLEQLIDQFQNDIQKLDSQLADPLLYENSNQQQKLEQLLTKRDNALSSLHKSEEEWMDCYTMLEQLA
ncbi:ABC-F family ATP-binding cassette domain-containing protein [Legionella bononiensis]|uniref:ATP-binding cassette domain-containing protein n=1 Tax=Legionella bononiensis TaxID=2793102 RepID=A0ABS1WD11_9GAMM|nr:ATP-binding cassette domain-containing protein [Legionella bononiensis]MBL7479116.1 ATP-binding cassette domain-containing protein [Legionella bononiensis]MBL7527249.1 ATP-binding cassette domain-containing protein [Legionella bononiensis]MBL7562218.1 ATP-binding cassette domain-containing protein [Legionella bononiensis]